MQVLNKGSAGEFGALLSFEWPLARSFSAKSHYKCDGFTKEFKETKCNPYESICREEFPDRFVLKKNSLVTDALRSIVSLENVGVIRYFSEVAPFVLLKLHWGSS